MTAPWESHSNTSSSQRTKLLKTIGQGKAGKCVIVDGNSLEISTVVAIARYGIQAQVDSERLERLDQSVQALHADLDKGTIIYGVNTGFGGSADTRTHGTDDLQSTLIRELHSGILPVLAPGKMFEQKASNLVSSDSHPQASLVEGLCSSNCMPDCWARASIIVRINSLASGYSGIRPIILESMTGLLKNGIVPRIPLRGSISASGDLMPLSYIGGTLQGDPAITVWARNTRDDYHRVVTADVALKESSLSPITLKPKEGLAIINGTAVSTGVAALAIHDANCLAVTSQVLTAMSVEALCGATESFDPIFAKLRPHPGQIEAAHNIREFLTGSGLATENAGQGENSLRQDRYSIRTASQWIGPVLEDLLLATRQVTIECNSVTDNPLIDVERGGNSFHGGNFQAKAITSAMEKTRSGLQALGQMLFAQCTELINPRLNNGLPPNLTADEPSESFIMKALDIAIAALQSELGFLSNSAGSHIQSAEMGNQSLNSLALISARYTHSALDILTQMASVHVIVLCQALDLRAMHVRFLEGFKPLLMKATEEILAKVVNDKEELRDLQSLLWHKFIDLLDRTTSMNTVPRFSHIFRSLQPVILDAASGYSDIVALLKKWVACCSRIAVESWQNCRDDYSTHPDATPLLGVASCRMYRYLRNELSIPFLRTKDLISPSLQTTRIHRESQPGQSKDPNTAPLDVETLHKGKLSATDQRDRVCNPSDLHDPTAISTQESGFGHCETSQFEHGVHTSSNLSEDRSTTRSSDDDIIPECPTMGSYVSIIYEAFRSGVLYKPVFASLDGIRSTEEL